MSISTEELKATAKAAMNLIEKYRADYNGISKDFKPEIAAEKRAAIYTKFSANISEYLPKLKAGAAQMKKEREKFTDPALRIVLDGMKADMNNKEVWLAENFGRISPNYQLEAVKEITNAGVKLGAMLALDDTTPTGKLSLAALFDSVDVQGGPVKAFVEAEKLALKTLFEYEDRPGSGLSASNRMTLGRQINDLDRVTIPANA